MAIDEDETFDRWRSALSDALSGPASVMAWQDRRYRFAYKVGQLLVGASPDGSPITDHVVYGVYVAGGGLVYVGQTADAKRRLRDLPVGESHHLATTVPPEIWERVIIVQWPSLLNRISADERHAVKQLELVTCGLAMEYRLQVTCRPLMTARRRSTKGGWSARNIDSSRSQGAVASSRLPELFSQVQEHWNALVNASWNGCGDPVVYSIAGRTVFPQGLL
jgi:hypothetical protein